MCRTEVCRNGTLPRDWQVVPGLPRSRANYSKALSCISTSA